MKKKFSINTDSSRRRHLWINVLKERNIEYSIGPYSRSIEFEVDCSTMGELCRDLYIPIEEVEYYYSE